MDLLDYSLLSAAYILSIALVLISINGLTVGTGSVFAYPMYLTAGLATAGFTGRELLTTELDYYQEIF